MSMPFQRSHTAVAFPSESSTTCGLPACSPDSETLTGDNHPASAAGVNRAHKMAAAPNHKPTKPARPFIDPRPYRNALARSTILEQTFRGQRDGFSLP